MKAVGRAALLLILLIGTAQIGFAAEAESSEWRYSLAPYLWASGLDGSTGVGSVSSSVDAEFADIVDLLDGGILVHFEASNGKWSAITDLIYLDLGVDSESPPGDLDLEQSIVEMVGGYRVRHDSDVDILFGVRWTSIDAEIDLSGPLGLEVEGDQSWAEPFVGFRWMSTFGEHWSASFRFDLGEFGVESDREWQLRANGGYRFSDLTSLVFGYRLLDYDYEDDDDSFRFDMKMSGAEIGVLFDF